MLPLYDFKHPRPHPTGETANLRQDPERNRAQWTSGTIKG